MKRVVALLAVATLVLLIGTAAHAIGIRLETTLGGTLEDTVIFATTGGGVPADYYLGGDLDLSATDHVVDIPVNPATTHWWLLGHHSGSFVYSSNQDLAGVDHADVEPFNEFTLSLMDPVVLLENLYAGDPVSLEQFLYIQFNHSSHMAADGESATLWRFASPGSEVGLAALSLHTNTPPDGDGPGPGPGPDVPEPATLTLLGIGLGGLAWLGRRQI